MSTQNEYSIYWNKPSITVTYSNGKDLLPLTYVLYDHPPACKFLQLLKENIQKPLVQETSFVLDNEDEEKLIQQLAQLIDKLGLDKSLSLNELHELVEQAEPNEDYDKLNRLIHVYEQYLSNRGTPRINSFFRFDGATTLDISNEDLLFFKMDRGYGDLCMGYNTLGKHWLEIAGRGEADKIDSVVPQKHINCEGYMLYRPGYETPFTVSKHFVEWYQRNTHKPITLDMALGYIVVGKLVMPLDWNNMHNQQRDEWTYFLSEYKDIVDVKVSSVKENTQELMQQAKML